MNSQKKGTAVNQEYATEKREGFTLIELLVVVAIIALLVAILIPSIQQARRTAEQVVCSGHLNQFGLAFYQFANDNADVLPGKAGPVHWYMGLNGTRVDPMGGCIANAAASYLPADTNNPYLFIGELDCPANDYPARGGMFSYGMVYTRKIWGDYGIPCGGVYGSKLDGSQQRPLKMMEIERPCATPLLVELWQQDNEAYVIAEGSLSGPQTINGYHDWGIFWDIHGKSMNIVFADRSVRPVSQDIWLDDGGNFPRPTYGPSGEEVPPLGHWFSAVELDRFGKPAY